MTTMTRTCYTDSYGDLMDYETARTIRPATAEEIAASDEAAQLDGGRGVIDAQVPAWVGLETARRHGQWTVQDPDGGIWWPSDDAQAEIQASDDPARAAAIMCSEAASRGEWRS